MSVTKMRKIISVARMFVAATLALFLADAAHAAAPGITGPTFNLTAQTAFLNQPDGAQVYAWGYGCNGAPAGFAPAAMVGATCPTMQVPGPTLIVTEGQTVTVNLTNNLPAPAGNTSILFPGFNVTATGGTAGVLTQEAANGGTVTYTFVANSPGTHAYYSGTQGDLQVEMGLYGAVIVLPTGNATVTAACGTLTTGGLPATNPGNNAKAKAAWNEADFRLAASAYDNPKTCYDREYLFQWAEMDPRIHNEALAQVTALGSCTAGANGCQLQVPTEPYHPAYFVINGRSMPDLMDANYAPEYPHQPYNGDPHMHPGEMTLIRSIGQGRWQHPFHEHANHVRILARDGNLQLAPDGNNLAGLLMFNTDTTPGEAFDGIFYFTGRGLNWDAYGHNPSSADASAKLPCTPDANGYNTGAPAAINYFEWCQDHNKPVEANPIGDVPGGGPVTLPNPNILTNGPWYGGTPYLGPDASIRGGGTQACLTNNGGTTAGNPADSLCTPLQPSNIQANPGNERGWAYMWHSHNEREITTNNVFPGGMLMMMLVDSREFVIDENK
ncbi:multicopper oxidase family protein [Acidobacteria bacterium AB60]|nr:multicopper oxidase family protein [Acidobacteria bacterium AB60]